MQETPLDRRATPVVVDAAVRRLTLVAAAFTVFEAAFTNHGVDKQGAALLWSVVGLVLLWFVYRRRSRVARMLVLVTAWLGVVVFALVLVGGDDRGYSATMLVA